MKNTLLSFLFLFSMVPFLNSQCTLACVNTATALNDQSGTVELWAIDFLIDTVSCNGPFIITVEDQDQGVVLASDTPSILLQLPNGQYQYTIEDLDSGNSCWGQLNIGGCLDDLVLEFKDAIGSDFVDVDVVALTDGTLRSMQFLVSFDGTTLSYDSVIPNTINSIDGSSFFEVIPETLNCSWNDPTASFVSFNAGDVLFSLRFAVLANDCVEVGILNSGIASAIEFIGASFNTYCLEYSAAEICGDGAMIEGYVQRFDDFSCNGVNLIALEDWKVFIHNSTNSYIVETDFTGHYQKVVVPGDYEVTVAPYNGLWDVCNNDQNVSLPNPNSNAVADFTGNAVQYCPYTTVDISTAFVRRCFDNTYVVNYCNNGTAVAEDASIVVVLSDNLSFVSTNFANFSVNGQEVTFDLGDLEVGCYSLKFDAYASCDSEFGETHCAEATISPNDPCGSALANWSGPVIETEALCDGGNVTLKISNTGQSDMTSSSQFIVVEDDVMSPAQSFQLDALGSEEVEIPANGSTYWIFAEQVDGFPVVSDAASFIEGCGENTDGTFSTGFSNMFLQTSYYEYYDIDCQQNIGSFDPNDKAVLPEGYGPEHYVYNNQTLSYKIRFQNTGTDTAFNIVIRDTISAHLDINSIRRTGASHSNIMTVDNNELVFTFNDVLLVDSLTNEPASHGFVTFNINMLPDLADDIVLENDADIYFDFNDPIRTNNTFLTIGTDFIEEVVLQTEDAQEGFDLRIMPNPSSQNTVLTFDGYETDEAVTIKMYDASGKEVCNEAIRNNSIDLSKIEIAKGVYFVRLMDSKSSLFSGKLVVN